MSLSSGTVASNQNGLSNDYMVQPARENPIAAGTGSSMPIAIIGLSCRYAGDATSPEKLWQLCLEGRSAWSAIPPDRFNQETFYHPAGQKETTSNIAGGYFFKDDVSAFDASFFNMSAEVASTMDPQCRLQLESVFEALESAGISLESISGSATGVYAGLFFRDYSDSFARDPQAYPRFLSPDGKCYAFDDRASGYGRGEGVGTLIIKPLVDAINDRDPIRGVIRGTAVNQNGKTQTITSPSVDAQEAVIRACYQNAGLEPSTTGYVEAHGTGTLAGDPVEVEGIARVLMPGRSQDQSLHIGSIKTNLGHTEAASGLAAIIKVLYALENSVIPPSVNYERPNAQLKLKERRFEIPRCAIPWPTAYKKRVSINNFGYGGTNSHVILDSIDSAKIDVSNNGVLTNGNTTALKEEWRTFILSARNEYSIKRVIQGVLEYLTAAQSQGKAKDDGFFSDLAYTLSQRRSSFAWSIAVSARNVQELTDALQSTELKPTFSLHKPRIGFVFTGQGAQWYAMGRELISKYPLFKESLWEADHILRELGCGWSLMDELTKEKASSRIGEVEISPPLCLAVQISLVRLLRSWAIDCTAVTGHSSGEVAAAYAANAIDYKSAMAIVYLRGALTTEQIKKQTGRGAMMAVGLGRHEVNPYLQNISSGKLGIACINSPSSVTISGDESAVEELHAKLQSKGIFARRLQVKAAFHSHHMEPIAKSYREKLEKLLAQCGDFDGVIYSSPVSGQRVAEAADIAAPGYWVRNMVCPVEFDECFFNMCFDKDGNSSVDIALEIGPHGALAGPMRQILSQPKVQVHDISITTCLNRDEDAERTMHSLVSHLVSRGYKPDMGAVNFPAPAVQPKVLYDLPSYPWNHEVKYWSESRLNKLHRLRREQAHDLLGSPALGCNPATPTWRSILRAADIPWIYDHRVQGHIVYPAAGFISMAIEGVRQLAKQQSRSIVKYHLRHVGISSALIVPESSDGIEVQLSLLPAKADEIGEHIFAIDSVNLDDRWTRHCTGHIYIEEGGQPNSQHFHTLENDEQGHEMAQTVPTADLFRALRSGGIAHGKMFQNIETVETGTNASSVVFHVADTASSMPAQYQSSHIIHPTTLDSIIVAAYTTFPMVRLERQGARVPRFIRELSVSTDMQAEPGRVFEARATLEKATPRSFEASVIVRSAQTESKSSLLELRGLQCQSLGIEEDQTRFKKWCSKLQWRPALCSMTQDDLRAMLRFDISQREAQHLLDIREASICVMHSATQGLSEHDVEKLDSHYRRLFHFMSSEMLQYKEPFQSLYRRSGNRARLMESVQAASPHGRLLYHLDTSLPKVMRGELQPLSLLLEHQFFDNVVRWDRSSSQIAKLIDLYSFTNPRARYLEIGAGTGACTHHVLNALSGVSHDSRHPAFVSYDFTDISVGFFEAARKRFEAWGSLINFRTYDADMDAVEQGFGVETYDVIIASHALHAVKNIGRSLLQVRQLLKPGGKLIFAETTSDRPENQLVFGMLPGWWAGEEEERQSSPTLSIKAWEHCLEQSGFNSLDVECPDNENKDLSSSSVMMATAKISEYESSPPSEIVLVLDSVQVELPWVERLQSNIEKLIGQRPALSSISSVVAANKLCIFLDEVYQPILATIAEVSFGKLQSVLMAAKAVLWVTRGSTDGCEVPQMALHSGLLRVLRCEDFGKRFITLDITPSESPSPACIADAISDVLRIAFLERDAICADSEYMARDGVIHVSRAEPSRSDNRILNRDYAEEPPELQPFLQSEYKIQLPVFRDQLHAAVFLSEPAGADSALSENAFPTDYVKIIPGAFSISSRHLTGTLEDGESGRMIIECSGLISELGPGLEGDFSIGDRVCALVDGPIENLLQAQESCVVRVPASMSLETAASLPFTSATAIYSMLHVATLQKDDRVVIHGAASDVGQIALQMAKQMGVDLFLVCRDSTEAQMLVDRWSVEQNRVIVGSDQSSLAQGRLMLRKKPIKLLVCCDRYTPGPLVSKFMAPFGSMINMAVQKLQTHRQEPEGQSFSSNIVVYNVDILALAKNKPRLYSRVLSQTVSMFESGKLEPVAPAYAAGIGEIKEVINSTLEGQRLGRTIISPTSEDQVLVRARKQSATFLADASYLVVGAFGGIGQSICRWMAERGVKNLILLSRNAQRSRQTEGGFLRALEALGTNVVIESCDICDLEALTGIVQKITKTLPPIKGVIHSAMILKDSLFFKMSYEQWRASTDPKVSGSWNLHLALLRQPLDFFILLSSIVGTAGNATQANYAAGNAFQDALARHRTSHGLPGTSIDLGAIRGVGYLANESTAHLTARFEAMGFEPQDEMDVLAVVEAAILKKEHSAKKGLGDAVNGSQIIVGVPAGWGQQTEASAWSHDVRFTGLGPVDVASSSSSSSSPSSLHDDLQVRLTQSRTKKNTSQVITDAVVDRLAKIFMKADTREIDPAAPLDRHGVDSLVAIELRAWLVAAVGVEVSVFDVVQSRSVRALAEIVAKRWMKGDSAPN